MTNTYNIGLLLSLLCLATVLVGGWYFQSTITELRTNQQEAILEQKEIHEKLDKLLLEQQLEKSGFKDQRVRDVINNNSITTGHYVVKRSNSTAESQPPQIYTRYTQILSGRDGRDGRDGRNGQNGVDGSQGHRGPSGPPGLKGNRGALGLKGNTGAPGLKGEAGAPGHALKGDTGAPGPIGHTGFPGLKGVTGAPGPKGDGTGGVVYVRWGHSSCPSGGAQLVYAGRAGGSHYNHKGGGSNPQCLPLDPNFFRTVRGAQHYGYMYGAEYEQTSSLVYGSHDKDVPCAVCYVPTRNVLYMIPAKYTCPSGWTREYFGYLMSERYNHHRSQFTCVDHSLISVIGSSHNHDGVLFYTVEGVCGSLPCPPYSRSRELSCAVCTR